MYIKKVEWDGIFVQVDQVIFFFFRPFTHILIYIFAVKHLTYFLYLSNIYFLLFFLFLYSSLVLVFWFLFLFRRLFCFILVLGKKLNKRKNQKEMYSFLLF